MAKKRIKVTHWACYRQDDGSILRKNNENPEGILGKEKKESSDLKQ